MMKEAVEKIEKEIEENKTNQFVVENGKYLIDYIKKNNSCAEKILKEDKSVLKSLKYVMDKVKKQQSNGVAMVKDEEVYKLVLDYFEIEKTTKRKVISLDELL